MRIVFLAAVAAAGLSVATCAPTTRPASPPDPGGDRTGHADRSAPWAIESLGYSGARIGTPGQPEGRHYATCVRQSDYRPGHEGPCDWPWRDVAQADTLASGDPCPPGNG